MSRQVAIPVLDISNTPGTFPKWWVDGYSGTNNGALHLDIDDILLDTTSGDWINTGPIGPGDSASVVFKFSPLKKPVAGAGDGFVHIQAWIAGTGEMLLQIYQGNPDTTGVKIHEDAHSAAIDLSGTRKFFDTGFPNSSVTNWGDLYLKLIHQTPITAPGTESTTVYSCYLVAATSGLISTKITQFPVSPVWAEKKATASTNGGALWQLINGGTKTLHVYQLQVWGVGDGSHHAGLDRQAAFGIRRTDFPFDVGPGGNITYANKLRLNPYDGEAHGGVVRCIDFTNAQFHGNGLSEDWYFEDIDNLDTDGVVNINGDWLVMPSSVAADQPFILRAPASFPWTVAPQSAIEVLWLDNAVNFTLVGVLYDEKF
jgi:hypothetical protein